MGGGRDIDGSLCYAVLSALVFYRDAICFLLCLCQSSANPLLFFCSSSAIGVEDLWRISDVSLVSCWCIDSIA